MMKFTLCRRDPCTSDHILKAFLLTALLSCCVCGCSGQVSITPDVPVARVGQTVTLRISHTLSALTASWYGGGLPVKEEDRILTYGLLSNTTSTGLRYTEKETSLPDGSLRITNVWRNHTGYYALRLQLTDGVTYYEAIAEIAVYDVDVLMPPVLVNTLGSGFIGYEFTLQCQAGDQTVERYTFFKDAVNVTCNQQHINCSDPSPFLSFHPIKESDSGRYTCRINNPVSYSTSLPFEVRLKVPISHVIISSNVTSGRLWEDEDPVQLSCTALGTDPVFTWMRSGSALPQDSRYHLSTDNSSLAISPVTRGDTGSFQCTASNTANSASSVPLMLPIAWRPNGSINCGANSISEVIHFSCSWPGGFPPASIQMVLPTIGSQSSVHEVLYSIERRNITTDMTLNCNGFQENHSSSCSLNIGLPHYPNFENNSTSNAIEGSPYSLAVNLGSSSSMRASSVQVLPATFAWYRGSSSLPGSDSRVAIISTAYFSQMTISQVNVSDSGGYHCLAENLMGTTSFSFRINVQPPAVSTELSGGAIAGIVIGVVALLVLTGVGAFFVGRRSRDQMQKQKNRSDPARSQPGSSLYCNVIETPREKGSSLYCNVIETPNERVEPRYVNMETRSA